MKWMLSETNPRDVFLVNWMHHMPFSSTPSTIAIKKTFVTLWLGWGRLAPPSKCPLFFLGTCPQDYNPQLVCYGMLVYYDCRFNVLLWKNLNLWLCWCFSCKWEEITLCTISCIALRIICNRELNDRFRLWYFFGSLLDFFWRGARHNNGNRIGNYWSLHVQRLCLCANASKLKEFFQVISWTSKQYKCIFS